MKNKNRLILDILLIVFIMPIFILLLWSVTSRWQYPNLFPKVYSLRGFEYIFNTSNIKVLLTSIKLSLVVVIISVSISIPASKALAFYNFYGKSLFELLVMAPIIIPMISIAMGINTTFIKLGLSDNFIGVVIINLIPCIPYSVRILTDTYKLIGEKMEVQAQLLGADKIKTFIYITLPLILPGIIGSISMCFIVSFSQYFLTMLIGGGQIVTYPMVMFPYIQSGDRIIASLYSLAFIAVSIMILVLVENRLRKFYKTNLYNPFLG